MTPDPALESEDYDFSAYRVDALGVEVSSDGYYTCVECKEVLEPAGEVRVDDDGRRRAMWECPSCRNRYGI